MAEYAVALTTEGRAAWEEARKGPPEKGMTFWPEQQGGENRWRKSKRKRELALQM